MQENSEVRKINTERAPNRSTVTHKFVTPDMSAMPSTLDLLAKGEKPFTEVIAGDYSYGDGTQASFHFDYCHALVLRSPAKPEYRGFAHIVFGDDPTMYVKQIKADFSTNQLEALVIKVQGEDISSILNACENQGIRVVDTREMPLLSTSNPHFQRAARRDIVVLPQDKKVIVNIEEHASKEIDF